jgi:hypothetical protein
MKKIGWILIVTSIFIFIIQSIFIHKGAFNLITSISIGLDTYNISIIALVLGIILLFVGFWRDQKLHNLQYSRLSYMTKIIIFISTLFFSYATFSILISIFVRNLFFINYPVILILLLCTITSFTFMILIFKPSLSKSNNFTITSFIITISLILFFLIFLFISSNLLHVPE